MKKTIPNYWSAVIATVLCAPAFAQEMPASIDPGADIPAAQPPLAQPPLQIEPDAAADASSEEAGQTQGGSVIEEIVVTAQRRKQNLQDVPISVTAVTADSLESMGVDSVSDLSAVSPGLMLQRQAGAILPYIRGIGTPISAGGQESAVALYVDGFYIPQLSALNFSFNNIERVEVLKGPQGTLFGRNATGGLIQIISRDPGAEPVFRADTRYDNYQTSQTSLYAGRGIAEGLNADFAVVHNDQGEGYGRNQATGAETNQARETGLRSTWLYRPGAATEIRASFDYANVRSSMGIARAAAPGARTVDGQGAPSDFWDIRSNFEPLFEYEGSGVGLKGSHDFGSFQFVSLTGYRHGDSDTHFDQDATPVRIVDARFIDKNDTLSQELQLLSAADSTLQWIVGLYYFDYKVDFSLDVSGAAAAAAGGRSVSASRFDTRSTAAYAQATYPITQATHLTTGLRYTADERNFDGDTTLASGPVIPAAAPDSQKENEPTWRLSLDHRFSPEVLGFVSYNRGFKSGVYNTYNINQQPVSSETVDAYEAGIKSDLLGRRLRLNTSAFFYDYRDLQVQIIDAGAAVTSNAAKAEIYGLDLEATALPTDHLELMVGASWLHSEYTSFPGAQITEPKPAPLGGNYVCTAGQAAASANCPGPASDSDSVYSRLSTMSVGGNDLIRAPKFTGNLTARYTIPTSTGEFSLSGSYVYNDGFYWEPDNRARQDAYSLINAQAGWSDSDKRFGAYVFGSNLSGEKYSQFLSGGTLGDVLAAQPPRTYGLGVRLSFD